MNTNAIRGESSPYELFTMVYHKDTGSLVDLIRDRALMPMDAAVLLYMTTKVNVRTSRISVSPKHVAETVNLPVGMVQASIKRLRKELVLGKGATDGVAYYMLNPYYFHAGHTNLHKKRVAAFNKLLA